MCHPHLPRQLPDACRPRAAFVESQQAALLLIKGTMAANGALDGWTSSTNYCTWPGVVCDASGYVTELCAPGPALHCVPPCWLPYPHSPNKQRLPAFHAPLLLVPSLPCSHACGRAHMHSLLTQRRPQEPGGHRAGGPAAAGRHRVEQPAQPGDAGPDQRQLHGLHPALPGHQHQHLHHQPERQHLHRAGALPQPHNRAEPGAALPGARTGCAPRAPPHAPHVHLQLSSQRLLQQQACCLWPAAPGVALPMARPY